MAEEVVKTIENVDRLFSEIIVNGESHVSQRYTSPSVQSSSPSSTRSTQGEDVHAVELNDVLHNFSDPDIALDVQALQQGLANETSARTTTDQALDSAIAQEANARQSADTTLQNNINTVSGNVSTLQGNVGTLQGNVSTLQGKVSTIESEIPSQASSSNQLADKNFVNSSISTNTANFLGTYTSLADIEAIQNPTNNDYAFLQTTDSAGNNLFERYKYNADQGEWLFEYELNNSSFTAEQWATINSGLTSSSVSNAINALDVASAGGIGKYIESIKQVDGKIVATVATMDTVPTDSSTKAITSGAVKTAIDNIPSFPLSVANGGTGETTAQNACNAFINALSTGTSNPQDNDYYVSQYAGGTQATYHRRPVSALWNYIKGKIQQVALTIGSTTSAIAETLYGSLSIKDSSDTETARISQTGNIKYNAMLNKTMTIKTGSTSQSKISLQTLMTWLITTKKYIPSGTDCSVIIQTSFSYADNDILQLLINGTNYELQLAGVIIEFMGNATDYQTGMFRLRIHSSPTTSFTATNGYTKFPVSHIAEYTCNGSSYSPTWRMLLATGDAVTKAVQDESGNNIKASYASSLEVSGNNLVLKNKNNTSLSTITVPYAETAGTLPFVTCSTASATTAKATGLTGQTLNAGYRLCVKFTYNNTATSPTLTVNGTNYNIYRYGTTTANGSSTYPTWRANEVVEFIFDGSAFQMISANAVSMNLSGSTLYIRF